MNNNKFRNQRKTAKHWKTSQRTVARTIGKYRKKREKNRSIKRDQQKVGQMQTNLKCLICSWDL